MTCRAVIAPNLFDVAFLVTGVTSVIMYFLIANRSYSLDRELYWNFGNPRRRLFDTPKGTNDLKFSAYMIRLKFLNTKDKILMLYCYTFTLSHASMLLVAIYSLFFPGMKGFLVSC
jgi:hypothetical protein